MLMRRCNVSHAFSCKKVDLSRSATMSPGTSRVSFLQMFVTMCVSSHLSVNWLVKRLLWSANSSAEARLDISTRGVWTRRQRIFFDVRVFDPLATKIKRLTKLTTDTRKKRSGHTTSESCRWKWNFYIVGFHCSWLYGTRVFSFLQAANKSTCGQTRTEFSSVSAWIRTKLLFALLRSALISVRGNT